MHWPWLLVIVPGLISGGLMVADSPALDGPLQFTVAPDHYGDIARYRASWTAQSVSDGETERDEGHSEWIDTMGGPVTARLASGEHREAAIKSRIYVASDVFAPEDSRYFTYDLATQAVIGIAYLRDNGAYVSENLYPTLPRMTYAWEAFAGETLREGDDWTSDLEQAWAPFQGSPWVNQTWYSFSSAPTVDIMGGATWAGQPALGIRYSGVEDDPVWAPGTWFSIEWTRWYVEGIPIPVHTQEHVQGGEGKHIQGEASKTVYFSSTEHTELIAFEPGDEPVPWGDEDPRARTPGWPVPPTVHAPDGHVPEGHHARTALGLEASIQHVLADPTLLQFNEWRDAHPDTYLGGFDYRIVDGNPSWLLTFRPTNRLDYSAFSVLATGGPLGQIVARDHAVDGTGPRPAAWEGQNEGPAPERTITLAQADEVARYVVDAAAWQNGPVAITWGLHFSWPTTPPFENDLARPTVESLVWPDQIYIEYMREDGEREGVQVFLTTGEISSLTRDRRAYEPLTSRLIPEARDPGFGEAAASPGQFVQAPSSLAVAAGSISLLTLMGIGISRLVAIFGYAKVRGPVVLDHPRRAQIMDMLDASPGANLSAVSRTTGGHVTTTIHHLAVLRREGYVRRHRDGRHVRWFPAQASRDAVRRASILKNKTTRAILDQIDTRPGVSRQDMAAAQGITIQAISWHLERLKEARLVEQHRTGRKFTYTTSDGATGRGGS